MSIENKSGKEEELKKLFDSWHSEHEKEKDYIYEYMFVPPHDNFSKDGIVDYEEYSKASVKILYIAREEHVYNKKSAADNGIVKYDCSDTGIVAHIKNILTKKEKPRIFYSNIAHMHAVLTQPSAAENQSHDELIDKLKEIAIINLNKRGGASSCNWEILESYCEKYADKIRKQISIINPDIIVCCGVYSLIKKYIFPDGEITEETLSEDEFSNKQLILHQDASADCPYPVHAIIFDYIHPSARGFRLKIGEDKQKHKSTYHAVRKFIENKV